MTDTHLILEDGTIITGRAFGAVVEASGEVVFNTGMVGYPEALTDPSYRGQILVLTYPLIGNYGVIASNSKIKIQNAKLQLKIQNYQYESERIQIAGLIVSEYCSQYSHPQATQSLADWLKSEGIPAIEGIDTRALTQKLRKKGTMLGKISKLKTQNFDDPNKRNLVAEVSCAEPIVYEPSLQTANCKLQTVLLYDCGVKLNIVRCLLRRGCRVIRVPWNYQIQNAKLKIDGIVISNGPGDPTMCDKTIEQIRKILEIKNSKLKIPVLGICLGNQLLALAAGAKTYKLKYGHRGQNQPVVMSNGRQRAFITTQNHGYAVDEKTLPKDWRVWFRNLNDKTVEGLRHEHNPWMSVQFHPEAHPGPTDTEWVFDEWLIFVDSKCKMISQNVKFLKSSC